MTESISRDTAAMILVLGVGFSSLTGTLFQIFVEGASPPILFVPAVTAMAILLGEIALERTSETRSAEVAE